MAIKTSGSISIQDIVNEFGGTAPHALNEYYKGGALVPISNANVNVPTSGAISLENFYGASRNIIISYSMYGGGGGGGNGFADGSGSGRAPSGKITGIMTKASYDALISANGGSLPSVIPAGNFLASAAGGLGGNIASNNGTVNGTAGAASDFGAGGAGGPANSSGQPAPWGHWGAAGGGGGGDNGSGSYFGYGGNDPGEAGTGGAAGAKATGTLALDPGAEYYIILGAGGPNGTGGNYSGGYGNPGALVFNLQSNPAVTYTVVPSTPASDANRATTYAIRVRFETNGQVVYL